MFFVLLVMSKIKLEHNFQKGLSSFFEIKENEKIVLITS
jgi:hypothetical protein